MFKNLGRAFNDNKFTILYSLMEATTVLGIAGYGLSGGTNQGLAFGLVSGAILGTLTASSILMCGAQKIKQSQNNFTSSKLKK